MRCSCLWCPEPQITISSEALDFYVFLLTDKTAAVYCSPTPYAVICILAPGKTSGKYEAPITYFPYFGDWIPALECMRISRRGWLCSLNLELRRKKRRKVRLLRRRGGEF